MWTRAELKSRAKTILRKNYWPAFLASLVLLFSGSVEGRGPSMNYNMNSQDPNVNGFQMAPPEWLNQIMPFVFSVGMIIVISALLLRIFIGYPLEVGGRRFFNEAAEERTNLENLGRGFNGQWYTNVVGAMFQRSIRIFLWTLLLIIPGIVKAYAYRFVPYLLADNPNMPYDRALYLSNQLTAGHKWQMFILDLSFIGWYILGLLALGIGTLFVHPYVNATMAELYAVLRREAVVHGLLVADELIPQL